MLLIWFISGLAIGLLMIGFIALGSYERGYRRARREVFSAELLARRRVIVAARKSRPELPRQPERATA
jgi:hypothetical protein